MVKIEDLWIGDHVMLRKSKRIGTFEGTKGDKLKVKYQGKIILTTFTNLEIYTGPIPDLSTNISKETKVTNLPHRPPPLLDLHIEKLQPSLLNGRAERILDVQVRAARNHIETAIEHKYPTITIIHGKGTGVLKHEVMHLLSFYDEVKYCHETNAGGGTEVTFHRE